MRELTTNKARKNLYRLIDQTAEPHEPVVISGKRRNAVRLCAKKWSASQETLHLLAVPGMRACFLQHLQQDALESPLTPE